MENDRCDILRKDNDGYHCKNNRWWLSAYSNGSPLSRRETEVLLYVADGDKNEIIAHKLSIEPQTVKTHIHSILMKLGAKNRTHAVIIAMKNKWLPNVLI